MPGIPFNFPPDLSALNSAVSLATLSAAQAASAAAVRAMLPTSIAAGGALPYEVSGLSGGIGTGSGGTNGTYAGGVAGGPAGFAWTYTIAGGQLASYTITNPGISTSTTAPTLSLPGGGLSGATVPTATVSTIAVGRQFLAPSVDGTQLLAWGNNAGAVASAPFGGTQAATILAAYVDVRSPDIYLSAAYPSQYGPALGTADDSATINAAIAAALQRGCARVHLPAGTFNANILVPLCPPGPFYRTIEIVGVAPPSFTFGTVGTATRADYGTVIVPANPSVAAISQQPYQGSFSINCLMLRDLTVRCPQNPAAPGVDARYAAQLIMQDVQIDTGTYTRQCIEPTQGEGKGLYVPLTGNGALTTLNRVSIMGFRVGLSTGEHLRADNLIIHACKYGIDLTSPLSTGNRPHSILFGRVLMQNVPNPIFISSSNRFAIQELNIERATTGHDTNAQNTWQLPNIDLEDDGNVGRGVISYASTLAYVGEDQVFNKVGGKRVLVRGVGEVRPTSLFTMTSAPSIPSGGAETSLVFQAISDDGYTPYGVGAPDPNNNPTRIPIRHSGDLKITFIGEFASGGATARRFSLYRNGKSAALPLRFAAVAGQPSNGVMTAIIGLNAGDYIELTAWHNDSGALALSNSGGSGLLLIERIF